VGPVRERVRALVAEDLYPLEYRVWEGPERAGTMVLLHGVMSHSQWLARLAEPLARLGFKVVGADRRGSGLNRRGLGDAPSSRQLVLDLWRVVEREHDGEGPLFLIGWCWGGVLALNALVEPGTADRLAGLVLLAPGLFPAAGLQRALAAQDRPLEDRPVDQPCVESPIREEMFTRGPWLHDFILKDELRLRFFSPRFGRILREMGAQAILELHRSTLPILLVMAERDVTMDRERTLRTFERLRRAPVTIRSIDCHHGIQFEAVAELVDAVTAWVRRLGLRDCGLEPAATRT